MSKTLEVHCPYTYYWPGTVRGFISLILTITWEVLSPFYRQGNKSQRSKMTCAQGHMASECLSREVNLGGSAPGPMFTAATIESFLAVSTKLYPQLLGISGPCTSPPTTSQAPGTGDSTGISLYFRDKEASHRHVGQGQFQAPTKALRTRTRVYTSRLQSRGTHQSPGTAAVIPKRAS